MDKPIVCEYCAQPLGTPERLCCDEWSPVSIGMFRAYQQGMDRWKTRPPGDGDFSGWCCGRWRLHFADIEAHLRDMHNLLPAR